MKHPARTCSLFFALLALGAIALGCAVSAATEGVTEDPAGEAAPSESGGAGATRAGHEQGAGHLPSFGATHTTRAASEHLGFPAFGGASDPHAGPRPGPGPWLPPPGSESGDNSGDGLPKPPPSAGYANRGNASAAQAGK